MKNVLETPRVIEVNGQTEIFENFDSLAARIDGYFKIMVELEATLDSNSVDQMHSWNNIAHLADTISQHLAAQENWLADHDAALKAEIADIRSAIRNLNDLRG